MFGKLNNCMKIGERRTERSVKLQERGIGRCVCGTDGKHLTQW